MSSKRVTIFGHRGAAAHAAENTLTSFRRALADGADAIELDVMRCRSGEVVVFHDDRLGRLCDRDDEVRSLDWRELRSVKVLDQEYIPRLEVVLDEFGKKTEINIELKTAPSPLQRLRDDGLAATVAELIAVRRLADSVIVSSFDPLLLWRFSRLAQSVRTALLLTADSSLPLRNAWAARALRPYAIHPAMALLDARSLATWHARGYRVNAWTIDKPAELRWAIGLGVDGVISNDPGVARQIANELLR